MLLVGLVLPVVSADVYATGTSVNVQYTTNDGSTVGPTSPVALTANGTFDGALNNFDFNASSNWISPDGLLFDGVNDYVSTAHAYNITSDFTLDFWFKVPVGGGTGGMMISARQDSTASFTIRAFSDGIEVTCQIASVPQFARLYSNTTYYDNNWHYGTLVRSTGQNVTFYVDGVQFFNTTDAGNSGPTANLNIGRRGGENDQYFQGSISAVRIWSRSFAPSEVATSFTAGRNSIPSSYTSLLGWYKMDEASGSVVYCKNVQTSFSSGPSVTQSLTISQTTGAVNSSIDFIAPTFPYNNGTETWSVAAGNSTSWRINGTGTQTLYLNGVGDPILITFAISPVGGGTVNQTTGSFPLGSVVNVLATPSGGYAFANFTDSLLGNSTNNPYTFTVTENMSVTGYFYLITHVWLTFDVFPVGGGSVNVSTGWFDINDTIGVSATPNLGNYFANWKIDGVTSGSLNPASLFIPGANHTYTAMFTTSAPVTLSIQFAADSIAQWAILALAFIFMGLTFFYHDTDEQSSPITNGLGIIRFLMFPILSALLFAVFAGMALVSLNYGATFAWTLFWLGIGLALAMTVVTIALVLIATGKIFRDAATSKGKVR